MANIKVDLNIHGVNDQPTLFHITHYKAGSQWVAEILKWCAYRRVVLPEHASTHFTQGHIVQGLIYPTVYTTQSVFDEVMSEHKSISWKAFYVTRDLRDTIVSQYFSLLRSHTDRYDDVKVKRKLLKSMSLEEGLCFMLEGDGGEPSDAAKISDMQMSWLKQKGKIFRFEDLIENEQKMFKKILKYCSIKIADDQFNMVLENNSFSKLTGGRARGILDLNSHHRKGIAGDWKNHFTPKVSDIFKQRFGQTLIATGYEKDQNW